MIAVVVTTTVTTVAVMTHHPVIQQEEVSVMIVVLAVAHHSLAAEVTIFVNLWARHQVHLEGRTGDASVLVVLEDFGLEIDL